MEPAIKEMAQFASSLRFSDLPREVARRARDHWIDTIGCACGGYTHHAAQVGRDLSPRISGGEVDAARWVGGAGPMTTVESAGFVNTAMVRYLDYNDTYPGGHPSDALGPVLALLDARGESGATASTALVVAYEVFIRIAAAAQLREKGWDQGFGVGLATTAALSNVLGLDPPTTAHALSIAAVSIVPTRATRAGELSHWKGAATAFAARSATFSTLLAAGGVTGPAQPISGRHGFLEQVSPDFDLAGFGTSTEDFLMPMTKTKFWPVEYNLQAVVWAALDLRPLLGSDEIVSVEIETYWSAWHETANDPTKWAPRTRETADHSMPFVFARAFFDGGIDVSSFDPEPVADPATHDLMSRVTVRVADDIDARFPAETVLRARATTKDGARRSVEVVNPLGDPRNPVTAEQVSQKFQSLAGPRSGADGAEQALGLLGDLENLPSLRPVLDALAVQEA